MNNKIIKEILSWIKIILVAGILAFIINNYIIANSVVPTGSMENTIMAGDRVIGNRLSYLFSEPERGDVIIFKWPDNEKIYFVKRIIGLPGDKVVIDNGKIYLNNKGVPLEEEYIREDMIPETKMEFVVPEGHYFMMGDNRNNSADSRRWEHPFVSRKKIIAKVIFKYFPGIKVIK